MRNIISISAVCPLLLATLAWPQPAQKRVTPPGPSVAYGSRGVVVSGKPAATAAGIKILREGGNAADAAAATLLALSVTYLGAFCVGGEIPILVYSADKKNVKLLEAQGEAPRDPKAIVWYMQHGIPDGNVKAAAVPSTIDAIVTLLKLYGTKTFEEVVRPTTAILYAGGPSWYRDTGSGEKIETGVNWQADLGLHFANWWILKKLRKVRASRNCKLSPTASIVAISPTPSKPGISKRAVSFVRRIWPRTRLPWWSRSPQLIAAIRSIRPVR
jgi:gamma-glutamyltranspeptidase / glutathione hydrolase